MLAIKTKMNICLKKNKDSNEYLVLRNCGFGGLIKK